MRASFHHIRALDHNRNLFFLLKIFSALGFFFPIWYMYESQYISLSQIAVIESLIVGFQLLLEIPTCAVADLFGCRVSILTGYFTQAVSLVLFVFANTFWGFVGYAIIAGLGEALKSGAEDALEYDSLKAVGKEHLFAKYKSWYSLIFQISLAAAFIIGGFVGQQNYRLTIWMTVIATFFCIGSILLLVEPPRQPIVFSLRRYLVQFKAGWRELTAHRLVTNLSLLYIAVGTITWTTNISLGNMYLTQIGFSASELGLVTGLLRIVNIIILMQLLKPLIQPKLMLRVFVFFILLFTVGYLPAFLIPKWPAIVLYGVIMASTTARWIILGNYLNKFISSHNRATALSTASMCISAGQMGIMMVAAFVLPVIGGPKVLISLLGFIGIGLCFLILSNFHQLRKNIRLKPSLSDLIDYI